MYTKVVARKLTLKPFSPNHSVYAVALTGKANHPASPE